MHGLLCIKSAYVPVFKNNHFLLRSSVHDGLADGETRLDVAAAFFKLKKMEDVIRFEIIAALYQLV